MSRRQPRWKIRRQWDSIHGEWVWVVRLNGYPVSERARWAEAFERCEELHRKWYR